MIPIKASHSHQFLNLMACFPVICGVLPATGVRCAVADAGMWCSRSIPLPLLIESKTRTGKRMVHVHTEHML